MLIKVTIEETVSKTFTITSNSIEEGISLAQDKYKKGEFVLNPGDLISKQIKADCNETGDTTEWIEF